MFENLISLFYPPVCPGCSELLSAGEQVLCTSCRHQIPLTNFHQIPNNEAFGKFYGRLPLEHVSALCFFHKKGIVQRLVHKLKYSGQEKIGTQLGYWYADVLNQSDFVKPDVIIPVPLHPKRLRERGYNQVTNFAKALSHGLQIGFADDILIRTSYAKTQTRKNLFQRSLGKKELFNVDFKKAEAGKHYLIVDDVITTGATLEACGRALLKIPDTKLSIACMVFSHS